jgi:hypothetical protein
LTGEKFAVGGRRMPDNNFLEDMRFFLPSARLTKSLFEVVEAVHRADLLRVSEDRDQVEDVDAESLEEYLKNLPPEEASLVASPVSDSKLAQEDIHLQQRFIAEELYHHLAFLARGNSAKEGTLPIENVVASGMASVLGISPQEFLLVELADEFARWLRSEGQFTTGWGNITFVEGNRLCLEDLLPHQDEAVLAANRMLIPHSSRSRRRTKRQDEAKVAVTSG